MTGSQIGRLLAACGISDVDISTKRHRLFEALYARQARDHSGNHVGHFIQSAMAPVRWLNRTGEWENMRQGLSEVLSFAGFDLDDAGTLVPAGKRSSFVRPEEAQAPEPAAPSPDELRRRRLAEVMPGLLEEFMALNAQRDRQAAGRMLECS